jgi:hypothetical protein
MSDETPQTPPEPVAPPPVEEQKPEPPKKQIPTTHYDADRRVFVHTDEDGNITTQPAG